MKVNVYVLAADVEPDLAWRVGAGPRHASSIKPGSGIVGEPCDHEHEGLVHVYFEGNLFGAAGLDRYEARVRQAAGRMTERYPTIAQMHVKRDELVWIGHYDTDADELTVENREALDRWLESS